MGNGLATRKARRIAASGKRKYRILPSCNSKSEEPADGPRRALENSLSGESLAPHAVTRDAWDVGTHDAEIGKLTVGEQVELTLGGVVTVPTLEAVAEEVEHGLSPMD